MVFFDDKADAINALIEAVEAIERELGIIPSGVYSDVRVRLDILEARINNPFAPAPNVENPFYIGNDGVSISTGTGVPTENRLPGSIYLRKDGYDNEGLYAYRPDGYWHNIDTDPFTAAGDLAGTIYLQTVIGLQGRPLSSTSPTDTPAGDGYVIGWNSSLSQWEPQIGFFAAGDLDGTKIDQTIVNIQGTKITIGTMGSSKDGYAIIWNNSASQWEPSRLATIFDPLNSGSSTNLRSNRYLKQSPINNSRNGIVNFSTDTTQITTGVTGNYGVIVGGDQNVVSNDYSIVVGGLINVINSTISFIGGGNNNIINTLSNGSVIVGGSGNILTGFYSIIGGGSSNTVTETNSGILIGDTNSVSSSNSIIVGGKTNSISNKKYSSILNGLGNNISGSISDGYVSIIGGSDNTISGDFGLIGGGLSNNIVLDSTYAIILGGENNSADQNYGVILNGINNSLAGATSNFNTILNGQNNTITLNSDYAVVSGNGNLSSSDYATIQGNDNILNIGSNYSNIKGNDNQIGASTYTDILGQSDGVGDSSHYSSIIGNNNTIGDSSPYTSINGLSNTVGDGYINSKIHGSNNIISSNNSTIIGNNNETTSDFSVVLGQQGKSLYPGQLVLSSESINSVIGSSQYSKIIMQGEFAAGGQFDLATLNGDTNLTLENSKSYDLSVRVLINNTSGSPTCARYVYDILAHCESGTVTLDVVNATILNDNSTGWTVSFITSGNNLTIRINSSGVFNRRAIATIDLIELSRA